MSPRPASTSPAVPTTSPTSEPTSEPQQQPQGTPAAASAAESQGTEKPLEADQAEDPNECGWCKWMKGGGCKSEFEVWLKCVDDVRDAGREDVESCAGIMGPLWDCMQKNSDYYAMQLDTLKGKSPDSAAEAGNQGSGGGLVGLAADMVEEIEEMVEHFMDSDDDDN